MTTEPRSKRGAAVDEPVVAPESAEEPMAADAPMDCDVWFQDG